MGKPIVQEQHPIPNHVPGILDFYTHQEHGWEHLLLTIPNSPLPWTQKWWCHGDSKLGAMLVFLQDLPCEMQKRVGTERVPPLANGNLVQSKKTTSNTQFPIMFLEMFLGFTLSRNIIGNLSEHTIQGSRPFLHACFSQDLPCETH